MRKLLFTLLIVFTINGFAQNDTIVNNLGKQIQVIIKKDTLWQENLYSTETRKLLSIGFYKEAKLKNKIGQFQFYDKDGVLQIIENYNKDGIRHGKYLSFKNKKKKTIGVYNNGKRNGMWNFYDDNGGKQARIIYKNDEIYKYFLWDKDGNEKNEPLIIEKRPEFPGGEKALVKRIQRELGPELTKLKRRFKLFVVFTIDVDGNVKNVKIRNPLTPKHKRLVEEFFYSLQKWKPAISLNRNIKITYTIPITLN